MANKSVFNVEKSEDSSGLLLWQTTITWQRLIKKSLDPYSITHTQFVMLAMLLWYRETNETPTQVLLATESKLDKMTVSKSLKDLATQGLVKRAEHQADSRAKAVTLTPKGIGLASKLVPIVIKIDEEFFGALNNKEQQSFRQLLIKLVNSDRFC